MKTREDVEVRNKAIYLALGVLPHGARDIPGIWIESTEAGKFWLTIVNGVDTRGLGNIKFAVTHGQKGTPPDLRAASPAMTLPTGIAHLIRKSLQYARWEDRKLKTEVLRPIYTAINTDTTRKTLVEFERGPWGEGHPTLAALWSQGRARVIPLFPSPPGVRHII